MDKAAKRQYDITRWARDKDKITARRAEARLKDGDRIRAKNRTYFAANRERLLAYERARHAANPELRARRAERSRRWHYLQNYGTRFPKPGQLTLSGKRHFHVEENCPCPAKPKPVKPASKPAPTSPATDTSATRPTRQLLPSSKSSNSPASPTPSKPLPTKEPVPSTPRQIWTPSPVGTKTYPLPTPTSWLCRCNAAFDNPAAAKEHEATHAMV